MASPDRRLDKTLLSAPGTPYAFSTAIKGAAVRTSHLSSSDMDLAGRLSLGSVGSEPSRLPSNPGVAVKDDQKLQSPNDTITSESLGILDLDAMGDTSISQFLTSPSNNDGLRLYLSETTSVPPSNQISLAGSIKPKQSSEGRSSKRAGPIDVSVISDDSEDHLSLSEGDLEQLNATLTEYGSDYSLTRDETGEQNELMDRSVTNNGGLGPSTSTTSSASVASSLTELANTLGIPCEGGNDQSGAFYNPFESGECDGSVGDEMFGGTDQLSFLQQLDKDELDLRKSELTPSVLKSFDSTNPHSLLQLTNGDCSMSTYFKEKSDKMGQLSTTKLTPNERPRFNDSVDHVIMSPPSRGSLTDTHNISHVTSTDAHNPSHVTSMDTPITVSTQAQSTINSLVSTFDGLTPVVTSHTPLSAQIPKLNLTGSPDQHNPRTTSSPGLPSMYYKQSEDHSQQDLPSMYYTDTPSVAGSLNALKQSLPSMYYTETPSDVDQGLPSLYFQPDNSTLMFPELSAVSSLPCDQQPPDMMTTPPSAYLPIGFDVTQVSTIAPPTFMSCDETTSHVTDGELSLTRDDSHVTVTEQSIVTNESRVSEANSHVRDGSHVTPEEQANTRASSHVTSEERANMRDSSHVTSEDCTIEVERSTPNQIHLDTSTLHSSSISPHVTSPHLTPHHPSTAASKSPTSPPALNSKLIASKHKLQTMLDASQFDVEGFLNSLKSPSNEAVSTLPLQTSLPFTSSTSDVSPGPSVQTPKEQVVSTCQTTVSESSCLTDTTSAIVTSPTRVSNSQSFNSTPGSTPVSIGNYPVASGNLSLAHNALKASSMVLSSTVTIDDLSATSQSLPKTVMSPRETSATITPDWLEIDSSLKFTSVCCLGDTISDMLSVANNGDRWLQVSFSLTQLYRDGVEVCRESNPVFALPHKLFIGPGHKEKVKVTFSPSDEGTFDGVLSVYACLVVSSDIQATPITTVVLKAVSETPKLSILTPSSQGGSVLDFGSIVGGSKLSLPVELSNCGHSTLPLKVSINCQDTLHRLYFTVTDMIKGSPSSPRSQPHSCSISLPPHPHNTLYTLHIQLTAPKVYHHDVTQPPVEVRGSLDIFLDAPHSSLPVTSIPVLALVGTAKLLAPGSFQGNDFSLTCLTGQTKSERVPLKNAGNIPLAVRVKMSEPPLFLVSPTALLIQPGQESHVDVTFGPSVQPLTCEAILMIHVEPSGPDYNLKLRGVAIQPHTTPTGHSPQVLNVRTLTLPDTRVGECSEAALDIHNPYSTSLQWTLTSGASPFFRKVASEMSSDMFKVNYPVFQVTGDTSMLQPLSDTKVGVLFQPQDQGVFSQMWDLQVCSRDVDQKVRLSFGGTAHPPTPHKRREDDILKQTPTRNHSIRTTSPGKHGSHDLPRRNDLHDLPAKHISHDLPGKLGSHDLPRKHDSHVTFKDPPTLSASKHPQERQDYHKTKQISKWLSQVSSSPVTHHTPSHHAPSTRTPPHISPSSRGAYMREEMVTFPLTPVGGKSTVKVQVCNRDVPLCKFTVIKPSPPFSVDHASFQLGTRQCARLPVNFSPKSQGTFEGILAIKTNKKHQMFAILRGESPSLS